MREDGAAAMPDMQIGQASLERARDHSDWPLFPLAVQEDVPFCVSSGYILGGQAESPLEHLDYCEAHCQVRPRPIAPTVSPVAAAESLFASPQWRRLFPKDPPGMIFASAVSVDEEQTKSMVRWQAVAAVRNLVDRATADRFSFPRLEPREKDAAWAALLREPRLRDVRWDARSQHFRAGN